MKNIRSTDSLVVEKNREYYLIMWLDFKDREWAVGSVRDTSDKSLLRIVSLVVKNIDIFSKL